MDTLALLSGLSSNWQDHFGVASNVSVRATNPNNNDRSVSDTVAMMAKHSVRDCNSVQVRNACESAGVSGDQSVSQNVERIFKWIKRNVTFVEDEKQLAEIFAQPNSKELLITPPVLLSMRNPSGDCDDFSMLFCAMCLCSGINCNFITIAADSTNPDIYSHIYCQITDEQGNKIPVDSSHGKYVGWEAPCTGKKMLWPVITGMKGMGMIYKANQYLPQGRSRGGLSGLGRAIRQGLGDDLSVDDSGNLIGGGGDSGISSDIVGGIFNGPVLGPSTGSSSSSGNSVLNSILLSLTNAGTTIAKQVTQQPGTQVYNPLTGQYTSYVAGNGATAPSLTNLFGTTGTSSLMPLLLIGGAFLLFSRGR